MPKHRLLFEKTGRAVYISHLDLMRTFQRAFQRAELTIRHTEGFNPHAFISIALPLSVGFSSVCECLDFELLDRIPLETVPARLNEVLPQGVRVRDCYVAAQPVRNLLYVDYGLEFLYDNGVPEGAAQGILALLRQDQITVAKKAKKKGRGKQEVQTDIAPLIGEASVLEQENKLLLRTVLRAQEPGLNPRYLVKAVEQYAPAFAPDFVRCRRNEILDGEQALFR